jgi:hypothetical protein
MTRTISICAAILLLVFGLAQAQRIGELPSSDSPYKSSFSLLDPNRFHMSQSYSFLYSTSRAGSVNLGMYLNSIEYQIADPLQIRFDIAYLHSPGNLISRNGSFQDGQILPGLSLRWRPSKNFLFQFDYHEAPSLFYNDRNGFYPSYIYPSGEGY